MNKLIEVYKSAKSTFEKNTALSDILVAVEPTIKYFTIKYRNLPIDEADLRAELLMELCTAVDGYNSEVGVEFKTYLSRCFEFKCNKMYRDCTRKKRSILNEDGEYVHDLSYEGLLESGSGIYEAEGSVGDYSEVEVRLMLEKLNLDNEERMICEEFARGLTPSEVGRMLGISPSMITYKVKKIRAKMSVGLNLAY